MSIWIKTQFGDIAEITFVQHPVLSSPAGAGWEIFGMNLTGRFMLLGAYDSEERAKEVAEEIERFITAMYKPSRFEDGYTGDSYVAFQYMVFNELLGKSRVFEMPEARE